MTNFYCNEITSLVVAPPPEKLMSSLKEAIEIGYRQGCWSGRVPPIYPMLRGGKVPRFSPKFAYKGSFMRETRIRWKICTFRTSILQKMQKPQKNFYSHTRVWLCRDFSSNLIVIFSVLVFIFSKQICQFQSIFSLGNLISPRMKLPHYANFQLKISIFNF